MKRPQTKFHTDAMSNSKAITSKKRRNLSSTQNYREVKISCSTVFFSWSIFY